MDGLIFTLLLIVLWFASLAVTSVNDQQSQNCSPKAYSSSQEQSEGQLDFLERTVSEPVSLFTFLLVVVAAGQLGLFWWQLDLIRDSVKDTNIAAIAAQSSAKTAERALTTLERPFVYCSISKPGISADSGVSQGHGRPVKLNVELGDTELAIKNFGRTPAQVTRFYATIKVARHPGICEAIDPFKEGGKELPVGTICFEDAVFRDTLNLRDFIKNDTIKEAIGAQTSAVWVVGYVRYDDIFGHHHINGFALTFDMESKSFVRRGDAKYNYEKKEEASEIPQFPSSVA